jgi:hypothetical protein
MQSAVLLWSLVAALVGAADTVVVCPQEFRQPLQPWLEHRQAQGRRIAVVDTGTADQVRSRIRDAAEGGQLKFVVLVGDADPALYRDAAVRARCVPAHYSQAVVNVKFGSTREIATDNWYADLDDDRIPDLALGRIACDTPAELQQVVSKILAYERSQDFGPWRRKVHFVAGLGGFGPLADTVMEAAAKSLIGNGIPSGFTTTMTYGSWQSPYCPDPRQFRQAAVGRLNEGSLFWVYIGHGQQRSVDEVHVPGGKYPILSCPDARQLACEHGAPIACFLACYSGAFDQPVDCLAEELLRTPGGPVAVLAGSRVTMPYAMSVMGAELLNECFFERSETLGAALLAAKRRMMDTTHPGRHRVSLDAVAKALSPTADQLEAERAEHLDLFNLLGDPLLRIPFPAEAGVRTAPTASAGDRLAIDIESPLSGKALVELCVRRDRLTFQPPRRGKFDPTALDAYAEVYRRANHHHLTTAQIDVPRGTSHTELTVPIEARGACQVRIFVEGNGGCAAGGADVKIEPRAAGD